MNDEKIIIDRAKLLIDKYKNRCDFMEIRFEKSERTFIQFQGETLYSLSEKRECGGNVRVYHQGGWGFVSFNDITRLQEFAEQAYQFAVLISKQKKDSYIPIPPLIPQEKSIEYDSKNDPRCICIDAKLTQLKSYNQSVLQFSSAITSSRSTYFDQISKRILITSDGVCSQTEIADVGGSIVPVGSNSTITQQYAVGFGGANDYSVFMNIEDDIFDACQTVVDLLQAPQIKAGTYPVICDPIMGGVFIHEAFGHLSESDALAENKKLRDIMQLGREFGSKKLNVYDSGLIKGARGYLPIDDEGVAGTKQYLIKDGILCGRLHTRETAAQLGEQPTGNARCISYRFPPICRMRDTVIEAGNDSFEQVIKDIDLGVYAVSSKGGQTNGEMFTFTAGKGYMIRNGQIAELVRDVTVTGNVFSTLKNIDAVCNDQRLHDSGGGCGKGEQFPLPVSHEAPHIRIQNVTVGGE